MMEKKIIRWARYCCVFIIQNLIISCGSTIPTHEKETETKAILPTDGITTKVNTEVVENKNFEYLIQSNGKIKSLHEQLVTCEGGGKLLVCNVQTGKEVSSGTLLLQLELTSIQYRLQKARLAQFNSEKEYESQLLGYENLLKDKTKEKADDIKQKLKISTGLAGAEQDIKEANYELSKAVIKAPFTGILADVKVQQGQLLKPGEQLFRIYAPNNLLLEIKVLEADISILKQGTSAEISSISNPEKIYKAVVYEINPYVDENGMVLVKLKFGNEKQTASDKATHNSPKNSFRPLHTSIHSLFPGMNCKATIKVPFRKTLVIPKEAVVMRNGRAVVFTLEEGKAKWNYVVTGRDNGKEVEIKDGLKQNQKVILTNNLQLAHDAPVKEVDKDKND